MPRSAQVRKIAAADFERTVPGLRLRCCEPTWKETPSPPDRACGHAPARRPPWPDRSRTCATAAIRRRHSRAGYDRTRGARRGAGDLLDLRLAVDRKEPHAQFEGADDVALLLDRCCRRRCGRACAGRKHHFDLGDRSGVEAGTELGEKRQHFRRRVRLHGVEHPGVRQGFGKGDIVVAYDVEIDDEARDRRHDGSGGTHGCAQSLRFPHG